MRRALFLAAALAFGPWSAALSQTELSLGAGTSPDAPVEITADSLSVDQATGRATFTGNVRVGQGDLRLAAGEILVIYSEASGEITELRATGGVTLATPAEAAEASSAVYDLVSGTLTMRGQVLLSQGPGAISADNMVINLSSGAARMEGNVRTVFSPGGN